MVKFIDTQNCEFAHIAEGHHAKHTGSPQFVPLMEDGSSAWFSAP